MCRYSSFTAVIFMTFSLLFVQSFRAVLAGSFKAAAEQIRKGPVLPGGRLRTDLPAAGICLILF